MEDMSLLVSIFRLLVAFGIFALLVYVSKFIVNKVKSSRFKNSRFLNPMEYFPAEEVSTLRQVFYLIMILIFLVIILYIVFGWDDGIYFISVLDIIISVYIAMKMGRDSFKEKLILFFLIPFGSIKILLYGSGSLLFDLLHVFGYFYLIHVYYRKFVKYTENNGLGITIILLFRIVLVSFLFTIFAEDVSPMDSITMVSNAFTSNSFDPAGKSMVGKLDSLVLAWGGFILSGVGTATLSVSIVMGYVNRRFDDIEDLVKKKKKED